MKKRGIKNAGKKGYNKLTSKTEEKNYARLKKLENYRNKSTAIMINWRNQGRNIRNNRPIVLEGNDFILIILRKVSLSRKYRCE